MTMLVAQEAAVKRGEYVNRLGHTTLYEVTEGQEAPGRRLIGVR